MWIWVQCDLLGEAGGKNIHEAREECVQTPADKSETYRRHEASRPLA